MTLKPIMEIAILESSITCGHTIQMRKHHSHDNAPDKPFLRGSKSKKPSVPRESTHTTPTTSTSGNSSPIPTGIIPSDISPGKHTDLCSQSMQQLAMWHFLYEKAVVDEEEYKKLQNNILSDIKRF